MERLPLGRKPDRCGTIALHAPIEQPKGRLHDIVSLARSHGPVAGVVLALALAVPAVGEGPFTAAQRGYWAFQGVARPEVPLARGERWVRNPVDGFVLRALRAKGLRPSREAGRTALIRRASLDLIGLPPSPEEVREFLTDESAEAYERLVERLLASPHYGERWARHWLDLARYAESSGFETDVTRPNAWRYRDYVVSAFNADKPYDRFVQEQIAGDEIWPASAEAKVATGFNRHYAEEGNQKDLLLARQEMLHDITSVVGSTFLGLTYGCAQCHDHKFDPITQKDYYRLQAFFANVNHDDRIPIVSRDALQEYERRLAIWEERTASIWAEMSDLLMPLRQYSPQQLLARYPDYVIKAVTKPASDRTPIEAWMENLLAIKDCNTCALRPPPYLDRRFRSVVGKLTGERKARFDELDRELAQLAHLRPPEIPRASGMLDVSDSAPVTRVLSNGQYTSPQESVLPGFLSILDPGPASIESPTHSKSTGRRTALAKWLSAPENPLAARVMANRLWLHHFGRGIVATPSDFGMMGERPTHPELLDWLADEFVSSGWSVKRLHRLIMLSSTYRQTAVPETASGGGPDTASRAAARLDPSNRLLWKFPRRRLEAEVLRDSALWAAGVLNTRVAGPSVFAPLPAGMPAPTGGWKVSERPFEHRRRSIYLFAKRNSPYPLLAAFDLPDTHESCAARNRTITAPQALSLLNGEEAAQWARAFAGRILGLAGEDRDDQVGAAYQLAYSREPTAVEKESAVAFLDRHRRIIAAQADAGASTFVPDRVPSGVLQEEAAALVDFSQMLLNSNEFAYAF